MRKMPKKLLTLLAAAALSVSVFALPACTTSFTPLSGDISGEVSSNGGFVVEKGNYFYFINGVDTYTSDNTYGTPVKGALMRIAKSDLALGNNTAETVIPSLMVAADYTAGIFLYGERVYYATPNNVRSTSGEIENTYLSFKSARLDGSDIRDYFNVEDNATIYRYVETENGVYLVYISGSDIHSYNVETGADTLLAADVGEYVLDSTDKTNPTIYYTMGVTVDIDNDGALERSYNQIYSVRADVTEAPYEYTYSEEYLEANDGVAPYTNLGTIVLDGIGALYQDSPTQFTHDLTEGVTPASYAGYAYTLQAYANDGIYFTRTDLAATSTTGETGWLYYLGESNLGSGWNSISGNASLDAVAQNTTYASTSALFYIENDTHHYLYIDGSNLFRADVRDDGTGVADTLLVARDVSGATLMYLDNSSDNTYDYVYYTMAGTTGNTIARAVYNGTEEDYKLLNYDENKPYRPVTLFDAEHASDWYNYEVVDGYVFFADTRAYSETSYNYISCIPLTDADGALMNNVDLADRNERYEEIVGDDGYLAQLDDDDFANLSNAIEYYFYMGKDAQFYYNSEDYTLNADGYVEYDSTLFAKNIAFAVENGRQNTHLYGEDEQELFRAYVEGTGDAAEFVDENGDSYRTYSYFVTRIGEMNDSDHEALESYWQTFLRYYSVTEEDEGLPTWAWWLIGVGCAVVVIGIGVAVFLVLRARKRRLQRDESELLYVDTTDDRDVDVYSDMAIEHEGENAGAEENEAPASEEEPAEEAEATASDETPASEETEAPASDETPDGE